MAYFCFFWLPGRQSSSMSAHSQLSFPVPVAKDSCSPVSHHPLRNTTCLSLSAALWRFFRGEEMEESTGIRNRTKWAHHKPERGALVFYFLFACRTLWCARQPSIRCSVSFPLLFNLYSIPCRFGSLGFLIMVRFHGDSQSHQKEIQDSPVKVLTDVSKCSLSLGC